MAGTAKRVGALMALAVGLAGAAAPCGSAGPAASRDASTAIGAVAAPDANRGAAEREAVRVPLWGRFQTEVTNRGRYTNPFADVSLDATFRSPSGRRVEFPGYYDGDGQGRQDGAVWRLRFMPDEPGMWSYTSAFSDGVPGVEGSFTCTLDGAKPGPLRLAAPRKSVLRHANGDAFYPRCYYLSEALTGPTALCDQLLDRFFGGVYGYNLNCTTFWQGRLLEGNRWNNLPYSGFHPIVDGDYTRLDIRAWTHADRMLERMEANGTVWCNFDGFVPNVGGDMGAQRLDPTAQACYVRNAVARLASYWNIVWNIAFEWSEFLQPSDVARLADLTRALDPWGHPIGVHDQGPYATGQEVVANLHVDLVMLQYQAGTAPDAVSANRMVRQYSGDWPVLGLEMAWEATPGKLNGDQVRRAAWGIALGGAYPCYAEMFEGPHWGTPANYGDGEALPYLEVLHGCVSRLPWYDMAPHNELVGPEQLCLARPGVCYVCYAQSGATIVLDLSDESGQFDCQWLNPRTGATRTERGAVGGGPRTFASPSPEDWALVVSGRSTADQ